MKRRALIQILKKNGAYLFREGRKHSIYAKGNLKTEVPRHTEIGDRLAMKILKDLEIKRNETQSSGRIH